MALKLITETINDIKALVEEVATDAGNKKSYYIEGIFMQGNKENQNGRVYPTATLVREMQRYQKEYIDRNRAFGELGHPDSPTVNLDRVSHMITGLQQDGDNFVGRAKIMVNTPMGNIVKALIDEGAELGVSSRGLGSLDQKNGIMEVQDDFHFSTVDIVADPSAPDAFVRGIMEGKSWVWESGALKECTVEDIAQKVDHAHLPTVSVAARSAVLVESFEQFLTALCHGVKSNIH